MNSTVSQSEKSSLPNWNQSPEIIAVSASDKAGLKKRVSMLKDHLSGVPSVESIHILAAKTRESFSSGDFFRFLFVIEPHEEPVQSCEKALECLDSHFEAVWAEKSAFYCEDIGNDGKIGFIFPGQGSQYLNMGKDIVACFPESRISLLSADEIFGQPDPLSKYIYPDPANNAQETAGLEDRLKSTDIAQPAIGAVSLAMFKTLHRFNVIPDATCGHSYGELSALYAGGRIRQTSFLSLSVDRGKFMAATGKGKDSGTMLAVKAPLKQIEELLKTSHSDVILANKNAPDQGVLSGPTDAILQMKSILKEQKIRSTLLPVAAAFHSSLVKDAALPFQLVLEKIDFKESAFPVYSNTTGAPYPVSPEQAKNLLGIQLISPVNFIAEIENMYQDGIRVFLEVGPKSALTGLVKAILRERHFIAIALDGSSGRHSGLSDFAKALCQLASMGYPVNISQWCKPV